MIVSLRPFVQRPLLLIPAAAAGLWLLSQQKGCEWLPDSPPVHASTESPVRSGQPELVGLQEGRPTWIHTSQVASRASDGKGRSIRRASDLLKQAAGLLDKNERLALRLVHQAIAILKHEVVPGMGMFDHDRVSQSSRRWPIEPFVEITKQPSGQLRPHENTSRQWRNELDDGHTARLP